MTDVIISTDQLSKTYRIGKAKIYALQEISLQVHKGEICSIVGPSGGGKSTLLHQLAGFERPSQGSVSICNENITKMNEDELISFRQEKMGFVFQAYNLLNTYTAIENVALPLMFLGYQRFERMKLAKNELIKLGLKDRLFHKPSEMSGGQQQRIGIARAFVTAPKIIFADEPTGNLDTSTAELVLATMFTLAKKQDITLVVVTHNENLAMRADRMITLVDGKIENIHTTRNAIGK